VSASGKLRQSGAHLITLSPVRRRGGGGGHDITVVAMLLWSAAAKNGSYNLRGPQRCERRSTMRTIVAGGVSSPMRGRNDGGGSNSDSDSGAPVA
jgi:hypothetical protein